MWDQDSGTQSQALPSTLTPQRVRSQELKAWGSISWLMTVLRCCALPFKLFKKKNTYPNLPCGEVHGQRETQAGPGPAGRESTRAKPRGAEAGLDAAEALRSREAPCPLTA